jgi:hypothetical protein
MQRTAAAAHADSSARAAAAADEMSAVHCGLTLPINPTAWRGLFGAPSGTVTNRVRGSTRADLCSFGLQRDDLVAAVAEGVHNMAVDRGIRTPQRAQQLKQPAVDLQR